MADDPLELPAETLADQLADRGPGNLEHALPWELDVDIIDQLPPDEREEALALFEAFKAGVQANPLWQIVPHKGELGWKETERRKIAAQAGREPTNEELARMGRADLIITGRESRGQVEFLELDQRGVYTGAVVASNRFGKTHIALIRAAIQTLPRHFIPPWLLPYKRLDPEQRDVRFLIAGRDSTNWLPRVIRQKLTGRRAIIPPAALHGGSFRTAWNGKERQLTFADGSVWWFVTYDMDTQAWAGSDVDGVSFDEEPLGEDGQEKYSEAVGRTIDREGDIRFTLTPVEGIGWIADELLDENGEPRRDDEVHVVTGAIDHNPHLTERGKARAIAVWAKRDPATLEARTKGTFVHREGLIFPEYRRQPEKPPIPDDTGKAHRHVGGHIRPDRPLYVPGAPSPRDAAGHWQVPVLEAIDPGINDEHPFGFTAAFLNNPGTDLYGMEDVLEVFYALKVANSIVAEQADMIREVRAIFGYKPMFTVIDPAAKNRNPETGRQLQEAFRREGINTVPGQNSRDLTYGLLRGRLVEHRYRVWSSADVILGDEYEKYRWKKRKGRDESVAKPEPIKRNDDCIDTQRYMVARIPIFLGHTPESQDVPDDDPRRELLRQHVRRRVDKVKRRAKIGGAW